MISASIVLVATLAAITRPVFLVILATLIPLPPASPELNPIEQVWRQLRQESLANRCYKDEEDIVQTCCDAWNSFDERKGAMKKLCSRASISS